MRRLREPEAQPLSHLSFFFLQAKERNKLEALKKKLEQEEERMKKMEEEKRKKQEEHRRSAARSRKEEKVDSWFGLRLGAH